MRQAAGRVAAAFVCGAALSGCGGDSPAGGVDGAAVSERAGEVTLSIGQLDGPEELVFGQVAGTALDADGRIYVADMHAGVVRVYGPDGVHLHDAGRPGEGPGELRSPCCLAFGPDGRLWVRNGGNGRYTSFELHDDSASFAGQLRMAHGDTRRRVGVGFRGDSLIDVGLRSEERTTSQGFSSRSLGLHRAYLPPDGSEPRWEPVEEIPVEELGGRSVTRTSGSSRSTYWLYPVHGPAHRIAHGPDGRWAEVVTNAYRVTVHHPDGREVVLERPTPEGPPLSEADREAARERIAWGRELVGSAFPEELAEIPPRKQPIRRVFFDAAGRVWVEFPVAEGQAQSADVWSPAGDLVERRRWPHGVALATGHALHDRAAVGILTDSLGVQRVVRVEWPDGG